MILSLRPLCMVFTSTDTSGPNGNNNLFRVVMYPGGNAAVLAQELREYGLRWMLLLPHLVAGGVILALHPTAYSAIGAFVLMCTGMLLPKAAAVERWLELHGHEAEVQASVLLYGAEEQTYRLSEAEGMQRNYDVFQHDSVPDIVRAMERLSGGAKRYVSARKTFLTKFNHEGE